MRLLSDLYNVTLKRGIRGAAKGGFVRPTIGENFMTHRDFIEIEKGLGELVGYGPNIGNANIWSAQYNTGTANEVKSAGYVPWQSTTDPAWLKASFSEPKILVQYELTPPETDSWKAYCPYDWEFAGSNDNTNWDVLDTRNVRWMDFFDYDYYNSTNGDRPKPTAFSFVNENPYKYYRFNFLNNEVHIDVVKLFEGVYE